MLNSTSIYLECLEFLKEYQPGHSKIEFKSVRVLESFSDV